MGDLIVLVDFVTKVSKSDHIESFLIKAHVLQLSLYLSQNLPDGMQFRYGYIDSCEYMLRCFVCFYPTVIM